MANVAGKTSGLLVPIGHGKAKILKWKRIDSDRLIEKGKDHIRRIPQSANTFPERLESRIYRRCLALIKPKYSGDSDSAHGVALHVQKAFLALLKDPDQYYGFFDFVVYKGEDIPDMIHSANGCLLTAALYRIPPWEAFQPELYEFYARRGVALFSKLHKKKCRSVAISLLAQEEHAKKAIEAIVDLFKYPSKI